MKEKEERLIQIPLEEYKELFDISEAYRKLFKERMELIKELQLRGGKLVITDLEIKEVWK